MRNLWFGRSWVACLLAATLTTSLSAAASAQPQRPHYGARRSGAQQPVGGAWAIPENTVISVRMDSTLTSKSSHVGDRFTATVTVPVDVNGDRVVPAGAIVEGHVTQVTPARRPARSGTIAVEFDNLVLPDGTRLALDASLTSDDPETRRQIDEENRVSGRDVRNKGVFVGSGGAVGAILGAIGGGAKGAVIGGAAGAGAVLAGILLSKGEEARVPSGTPFGVQLRRSLPVHPGAASDTVASSHRNDSAYPDPRDAQRDPASVDDRGARPSDETPPERQSRDDRQTRDDHQARDDHSSRPPADAEPDPDPVEAQPSRQPVDAPPSRQPVEPRSRETGPDRGENNSTAAAPAEPAVALPLNSPEMARRAQTALRDEGYYEGEISDQWSPRATNSLKTYQREHKLPETGNLDEATAKTLGLRNARPVSQVNQPPRPPVARTESRPANEDRPGVRVTTPANSSSASDISPAENSLTSLARSIQSRAGDLLADHKRQLGMSGDRRDDGGRSAYSDADVELLFALNSFANAANLYAGLIGNLQDSQSKRQATLDLARQARHTDRIITVSTSRAASGLLPRWDNLRQDVLRLMRMFNISTAEIEN
jgi:Putative peptidoglycan binding domain